MKSYHNTNHETGDQLKQSCIAAMTQQDQILNYFTDHPGRHFTPAEIQAEFPSMLLTSIRRAISNLTDAELLTKTELRSPGKYNKMNHNWRLAGYRQEQRRLFQ